MPQSKLRELLQSLKARYPTASAEELTDHFMEELRSDEELHKTVREELFSAHEQRARSSVAKKLVAALPPPSIRCIEAPLIPGLLPFQATCIDSSKRSIKSLYCDGFSLSITVPP